MAVQMAIPFSIDPSGSVATVTDPVQSLADRVRALMGTLLTQRAMRATLGISLTDVMFAWDPNVAQMQLEEMVRQAVAMWEPSARVISVAPILTPDGAEIIGVDVDISAGDPVPVGGSSQYSVVVGANGDVVRTL